MKCTDQVNPDQMVRSHSTVTMGKPQELGDSKQASKVRNSVHSREAFMQLPTLKYYIN